MTWRASDRVKETTTTTGTGDVTLLGGAAGFKTFAFMGVSDLDRFFYAIVQQDGSQWEIGIGALTTGGTKVRRDKVYSSSVNGISSPGLVNFAAGTKDIFITHAGELGLFPVSRHIMTEDMVIPEGASSYIARYLEIADSKELEIGLDGDLEVG